MNHTWKASLSDRTLQEAVDELRRELQVRQRCFPKWVEEGRLSHSEATDRYERLLTALNSLQEVIDDEPGEEPDAASA